MSFVGTYFAFPIQAFCIQKIALKAELNAAGVTFPFPITDLVLTGVSNL